jgi:hypothetical protein
MLAKKTTKELPMETTFDKEIKKPLAEINKFQKLIKKFESVKLPIEGNEVPAIECPFCKKIYRPEGTEDDYKPYNKPCKHILLHLVSDFDEAVVDRKKIYKFACYFQEHQYSEHAETIALAMYHAKYPKAIIKRYITHNGCCGELSEQASEFIVFSKEV